MSEPVISTKDFGRVRDLIKLKAYSMELQKVLDQIILDRLSDVNKFSLKSIMNNELVALYVNTMNQLFSKPDGESLNDLNEAGSLVEDPVSKYTVKMSEPQTSSSSTIVDDYVMDLLLRSTGLLGEIKQEELKDQQDNEEELQEQKHKKQQEDRSDKLSDSNANNASGEDEHLSDFGTTASIIGNTIESVIGNTAEEQLKAGSQTILINSPIIDSNDQQFDSVRFNRTLARKNCPVRINRGKGRSKGHQSASCSEIIVKDYKYLKFLQRYLNFQDSVRLSNANDVLFKILGHKFINIRYHSSNIITTDNQKMCLVLITILNGVNLGLGQGATYEEACQSAELDSLKNAEKIHQGLDSLNDHISELLSSGSSKSTDFDPFFINYREIKQDYENCLIEDERSHLNSKIHEHLPTNPSFSKRSQTKHKTLYKSSRSNKSTRQHINKCKGGRTSLTELFSS